MRIPPVRGAIAVVTALALVGCSTSSSVQPFWQNFGFKSKKAAPDAAVANAPLAPSFHMTPATAPTVSMTATVNTAPTSAANLPCYPGTNYPVTPYPQTTLPASAAAPAVASAVTPAAAASTATNAPTTVAGGFAGQPATGSTGAGSSYSPQQPPSAAYDYNAAGPSGTMMR